MAEIFNIDLETGDLTEWDSTSDSLATFDAHADATKLGSYGMRCIGAGTGYGRSSFSANAEVWVGFHLYIDSNISLAQWGNIGIAWARTNTYRNDYLGLQRRDSGSGVPTHWSIGGLYSNTNFSVDTWHWVEMHFKTNDAVNGGYEVWVDGDLVIDNNSLDWSGYSSMLDYAAGPNNALGTGEFLYFDNIIADNAGRVTEPTAGISIPVVMKHLREQGIA